MAFFRIMSKFECTIIVIFAVLNLNRSAVAIECVQGQRLLLGNNELINNLLKAECGNRTCHRFDITASSNGQIGKKQILSFVTWH